MKAPVSIELINPESRAEDYRKLMMRAETKERKFFLAKISGTEQERDTSIFKDCFRVKDYINVQEGSEWALRWLQASLEEILSSKFLGLDEFGRQKLDFQNPGYVAAFRLGGDPRDYNNAFTVQVNGCCYECSFCFVPRELNNPCLGRGSFFSAAEIVDNFIEVRRHYFKMGKPLNVIRLSGGEPTTLVPELIVDLNSEINSRKMSRSTYLWVDTNLSSSNYMRNVEDELKIAARQRNVGFVGCLKAVGNRETGKQYFSSLTMALPKYFEMQFEVLDYFVNEIGADFYLYLLPIISTEKSVIRKRLEECFQELLRIHRNLPLRTNMLRIIEYTPAKTNLKKAEREGRPLPRYDERAAFKVWYEILHQYCSPKDLLKYRCQVPLD